MRLGAPRADTFPQRHAMALLGLPSIAESHGNYMFNILKKWQTTSYRSCWCVGLVGCCFNAKESGLFGKQVTSRTLSGFLKIYLMTFKTTTTKKKNRSYDTPQVQLKLKILNFAF